MTSYVSSRRPLLLTENCTNPLNSKDYLWSEDGPRPDKDTMLPTGDRIHATGCLSMLLFAGNLTGISIDRLNKVWNHGA